MLRAAGSDSHEPGALGSAFVSVEPFEGPQESLKVLAADVITGRLSRSPSLLYRARGLLGG